MQRILSALLLIIAIGLAPLPAGADELQDIRQLATQGQRAAALERLSGYLITHPKDAQARFLQGLLLTQLDKTAEAIAVFTALTQDYPELPEPYNNLAVLYASQQQYDRARTALETAIRIHSGYATAHENLGDIHAKLASLSYDKALQLDRNNPALQAKLSLTREILSAASRGGKAPAKNGLLQPSPAPATPALPADAR